MLSTLPQNVTDKDIARFQKLGIEYGAYYVHSFGLIATNGQVLAVSGVNDRAGAKAAIDCASVRVFDCQALRPPTNVKYMRSCWYQPNSDPTTDPVCQRMEGSAELRGLGEKWLLEQIAPYRWTGIELNSKDKRELRALERRLAKRDFGAYNRAIQIGVTTVDLNVVDLALKTLGVKSGELTAYGELDPLFLLTNKGVAIVMPFRK